MSPKNATKLFFGKPAIAPISRLLAATVHVDRLTVDTRAQSIRDALRVVTETEDD